MTSRRLQTYATDEITVSFDPTRCIHAAECIRTAPAVFDSRRKRWIRPDLGTTDEIVTAVGRCPTGALSYVLPNGPVEGPAPEAAIVVRRDGPLYLRGAIRIEREDGGVVAETLRVALCRCGATKNAPFCDNSHREIGFRDPR
ncbi:MAG TPA: (4Fe-4S)-binding protein [Gemmatimonadaceae bacterium]|nr:(4Fe-4S)-binding protein [Gemmatimonadaceae bacterium]